MKLTEFRACPNCGKSPAPLLYEITVRRHAVVHVDVEWSTTDSFEAKIVETFCPQDDITFELDLVKGVYCQGCALKLIDWDRLEETGETGYSTLPDAVDLSDYR